MAPPCPEPRLAHHTQAQHVGPFKDALEIKRKGSEACEVTLTLHVDWQPERFVVDPRLSELLNLKTATKAEVIEAFWGNVKRHRLQDPKLPQQINLPMELAQVSSLQCGVCQICTNAHLLSILSVHINMPT